MKLQKGEIVVIKNGKDFGRIFYPEGKIEVIVTKPIIDRFPNCFEGKAKGYIAMYFRFDEIEYREKETVVFT